MRIGINTLYLIPGNVGGTEIFLRNLLKELAHIDENNQYILFTNREGAHSFDPLPANWLEISCDISPIIKPYRVFWEQWRFPGMVEKNRIDLLHSPGYVSPLKGDYAKIVTLFDMNYYYYPETFSLAKRLYWNRYLPKSSQTADLILTVSEYSKKDISKIFHLPESKIRVTHGAVSEEFYQFRSRKEIDQFLQSKKINPPYILSVATFNKHKNLDGVVRAYTKMKQSGSYPHHLVLVGIKGDYYLNVLKEIQQSPYQHEIHILDPMTNLELPCLYQGADLFVLLSYFEGFGLPVIEAMAGGIPVICSNRTSLPEIAGDAAILVDPDDETKVVGAMVELLRYPEKRKQLGEKGKIQAQQFSWKKMAQLTLTAYQDAYKHWKESRG